MLTPEEKIEIGNTLDRLDDERNEHTNPEYKRRPQRRYDVDFGIGDDAPHRAHYDSIMATACGSCPWFLGSYGCEHKINVQCTRKDYTK